MKVVLPKPDSPATWNRLVVSSKLAMCSASYHDCECSSSLGDNLVPEGPQLDHTRRYILEHTVDWGAIQKVNCHP